MPPITEALRRYRQRVMNRVRGEPNLERLVAAGMRLGVGAHISNPIYFDQLHPWLIEIGDHVTLAPYVAVITHDASLAHHTGHTRLGSVTIGHRVHVGVGAVLLPGTKIGDDSVLGAGTVVSGEVPPASLVVGNPAKISPLKPVVAWHRASASRSPNWPGEGSSMENGITEERKREQREALAGGGSGYVPAFAAPGSPYALRERDS